MGKLAFKWKVTGVEEYSWFQDFRTCVLDSSFLLGFMSLTNFIFLINTLKCVIPNSDIRNPFTLWQVLSKFCCSQYWSNWILFFVTYFLSWHIAEAGNDLIFIMFCVGIWENARDFESAIRICPQSLASFLPRELCLSYYLGKTRRGVDPYLNSEKIWLQEM